MHGFMAISYRAGITTGSTVTSGASSANAALPTDAKGTTARHVMLTSTGTVHVKLGIDNTVTAAAGDLMIGATPVILHVLGFAYIAYLQESAAAKLNIAPVEA